MKNLLMKSAIASGVLLSLATISRPAMASSFTVSIEKAGVENANLSNLVNANVENFDSQTQGYNANGFAWNGVGKYTNTLIEKADQYGGGQTINANGTTTAAGNGNYFDVDSNRSGNGQTVSTLFLNSAQSYFGLWWSAGDATNSLTFLSKGKVVETLTTADVKNYISKLSNAASYLSNPSGNFQGQDSSEPFAFINFYDVGGTFDEVQFSNLNSNGTLSGTGFESDNHTVATGYNSISGQIVTQAVPESSSALGVFAIGFVGAASVLTRRKKKSVLQLS